MTTAVMPSRALVALVWSVAFAETLLLATLAPLLPAFEEDLGLSKLEVGILNGAYPMGTFLVAVPASMLGARFGLRRAVALAVVALAASTVAVGVLDSFAGLTVARLVQGAAGGGVAWPLATAWLVGATDPGRRGTAIGGVLGISIFGATLGPALGALATADRAVTFVLLGGAVAAALLLLVPLRSPARTGGAGRAALAAALREPDVQRGLVFVIVPGALFGVIGTLLPLQLDRLGGDAGDVAAVFVISACVGAVVSFVGGRLADRLGRRLLLRVAVLAAVPTAVVLPHLDSVPAAGAWAVLAMACWNIFWPPAMATLADGAHRAGVEQALAFGIQSMAWGPGAFIGSVGAGALAAAAGDGVAWAVLGAACLASLPLTGPPRPR